MRREVRHAFAAVAGAKAASFASQRDEALTAAGAAAKAAQAVLWDAAAKELLKCVFDEAGDTTVLARLFEKRGQVAIDDLVQDGLSRISSHVGVTRWA